MSSVRTRRGFTLIEVMVAMAMVGIALAVTVPLLTLSIERGAHARKVTGAQLLAQDVLERLRAEVRYDSTVASPANLAAADAWAFDVLPHAPDVGGAGAPCNSDGTTYDHGPFRFDREGETYTVCYRLLGINPLDPAHANLPAGSLKATVRVLWRGATGGWSSWSLSDLLVSGS